MAKETYYSNETYSYGKRDLLFKKKNRTEAHHVERELLKQVQVTGKRDLLYGKRDLLYGKRDLLYGKRDLLLPTSFTTASSSS